MDINITHGIEGAKDAKGLAVIIDVFRAFSVTCYIANNHPKTIIVVGDIEDAYRLKEQEENALLIGERGSITQPGFDFGNSPSSIKNIDFTGKTVIHTTSAGTQGIVNARQADEIITGSFVNAQAIIDYIVQKKPETVTLVCMGWGGTEPADEDHFCAQYINNALLGIKNNFDDIVEYLREKSNTTSFLTKVSKTEAKEDFGLCLALNHFNFVLKAVENNGHIHLRKVVL